MFRAALLLVSTGLVLGCPPGPSDELRRWNVLPPAELEVDVELGFALSPDGERIAFVASESDATARLWVQRVGSLEAAPIDGTEGASLPFWSPDGRSLGFFAAEELRTVSLDDGTTRVLAEALVPHGGSWGTDGTILFAPTFAEPIHRVPAAGGPVTTVSSFDDDRRELSHLHPQWLPDGKRFLYSSLGEETDATVEGLAIVMGSIDSEASEWIVAAPSAPRYAASGHLLYVRDRSLVAERFEPETGPLAGDATVLARDVAPTFRFSTPASLSRDGRLLYHPSVLSTGSVLTWVGRDGRQQGTVGDVQDYGTAMLSPDGRKIATSILDPLRDETDIWIIDLERGTSGRLSFAARDDQAPVWSPDGEKIYYYSDFATESGTFVKPLDPSAEARAVYTVPGFNLLWSVSPDDRTGWLLVNNFGSGTRWDVAKLDLETGATEILLDGPDRESGPEISPDGRHLAFHSDASGELEVYVVAIDDPSARHQVSVGGGSYARWSRDGAEVVYKAPDGYLMAAALATEPELHSDPPERLFEAGERDGVGNRYSVSRDGERFLINRPAAVDVEPWVLVENWLAMLPD